jgi:prepilin-type N-terminal cleavage/methylation domain-containing protein
MRKKFKLRSQKGISLIEVLVALAILSLVGLAYISSLSTSSKALFITDEQQTARNIAEMQLEDIRSSNYSLSGYEPMASIASNYPGYSVVITPDLPREPFINIQRIEVTVFHDDKELYTLVTYKESFRQ